MKKKICRGRCKRDLIISQRNFYRNPDSKDGYRNTCKKCENKLTEQKRLKVYSPFFSNEICALTRYNKFKVVHKFGYFYGILVFLRPNEILAFSIVRWNKKGSKVFEKEKEARAWLYLMMIHAGEKTRVGLEKLTERKG